PAGSGWTAPTPVVRAKDEAPCASVSPVESLRLGQAAGAAHRMIARAPSLRSARAAGRAAPRGLAKPELDSERNGEQIQQADEEGNAKRYDDDKVGNEAGREPQPATLRYGEKPCPHAEDALGDETREVSGKISDWLEYRHPCATDP